MYYLGKILQALGLGILFIGFIVHFPKLVDYKTFALSICFFLSGWVITQYLVKK